LIGSHAPAAGKGDASMDKIDFSAWARREAYAFFSQLSHPYYMVSFRQDVTGLYDHAKAAGLSCYHTMLWACTDAVNRVEAFRVALRGGELVRLKRRRPSFTHLEPGEEQFRIITMDAPEDLEGFCRLAGEKVRTQRFFIDPLAEGDDLIYLSCLPWVELSALTNERDMSDPDAAEDSIPRLAWGKLAREGERKLLTLSLEVNHRFIDGLHIGRFAQALTDTSESLEI